MEDTKSNKWVEWSKLPPPKNVLIEVKCLEYTTFHIVGYYTKEDGRRAYTHPVKGSNDRLLSTNIAIKNKIWRIKTDG